MAKKIDVKAIEKELNKETETTKNYTPHIPNTPETLAVNASLNSTIETFWSTYISEPLAQNVLDGDLDLMLLVTSIRKALVSYFDYNITNKEYNNKEKRDFQRKLEKILFQDGKAVIFKFNKKWYPSAYTTDDVSFDFYGNPKSVKINLYLGLETKEEKIIEIDKLEDFIIVYNNSDKKGTLWYLWNRLKETVKRMWDLDHSNAVSRPQILWKAKNDDASIRDVELSIKNTDKSVVKIPTTFKENIEIWSPPDVTASRQSQVVFYINFLFKFLGFDVNEIQKQERETELEVRKTETLTVLIKDMYLEREAVFKDLTERGFKISIDYDEKLERNKEESQKVNGEENKKITGQDKEGEDAK